MATDWIDGLKVAELKEELKKRGLLISGKKAELAARLKEHVEQEDQLAAEAQAPADEAAAEDVGEPAPPPAEKEQAAQAMDHDAAGKEAEAPPESAAASPTSPAAAGAPEIEDGAAPMEEDEPAAAEQPMAATLVEKKRRAAEKPAEKGKKGRIPPPGAALTMADISRDSLTRLAADTWSGASIQSGSAPAFDAALVDRIYAEELGGGASEPAPRRVALLELSQYLENYLWRGYPSSGAGDGGVSVSPAHLLSIMLMVNEKVKEGMPAWECFAARPDDFAAFFAALMSLRELRPLSPPERLTYITFLTNAFESLENELVRGRVLRLVGLSLWHALSKGRLQLELHDHPQLAKHWKHLAKKEAKAQAAGAPPGAAAQSEATFLPFLLTDFLELLVAAAPEGGAPMEGAARYCERFVSFLTTLLSQLPTRRFVRAVLEDKAILVKCYMSALHRSPAGTLFRQLVDGLRSLLSFPIDDHTGDALGEEAVIATHYERVQQLQRLLFAHWPKLREAALANCGTLEKREVLTKFLSQLTPDELRTLATAQLRLVDAADPWTADPAFLTETMVAAYERRRPQREVIEAMPLYPTEELLLDADAVPGEGAGAGGGGAASSERLLALPRLNLQFLTLQDYLVRNFYLFRLEAAYEVREDVADVVRRTAPYLGEDNAVHFGGWARMGQPLQKFSVVEVRQPKVGERCPAGVTAEIVIDTRQMRQDVQAEWDGLKQHDVVFLLSLAPPDGPGQPRSDWKGPTDVALRTAGLRFVRGCEVIEIADAEGKLMNDFTGRVTPEERGAPKGTVRTLTVALDPMQYQQDASSGADVYSSFTLVMRRHAKENNFKAVLESIRDLVADEDAGAALPAWLHDVLLGYGDPADAQYPALDDACLHTVDFKDTFLDADHLKESFPAYEVEFKPAEGEEVPRPPFRVTFPSFAPPQETPKSKGKRKAGQDAVEAVPHQHIVAESYSSPDPGPYPQDAPPLNAVRFTPVQTSAILSGVQPGLTMVVGPPGTGKTDTAVQIMHILHHNCPGQRTLLITHSNQALNDLFQKIVGLDVPSRYLLRLGMGEADLDTEEQFSRAGRVNAMLARRLELLAEVERLARSLKVPEGVAYTCETAGHFWLLHVLSRWEKYSATVAEQRTSACVSELFPFKEFFLDTPAPLFHGQDCAADWSRAQGCFRHLRTVFQELEEIRPFEVLKTQGDRINYLLTKQAKIVAMTCTHAALKRREFLELGFTYDNLLMEEAAQVLEVETALPLLLQRAANGASRLKRVILIGDHNQLPPVVKNSALQRVSRMDQSMFTRFIRLGSPHVELNAQGRARPSLAALYNWRYRDLGDLPLVASLPAFRAANPGFAFDYQLVDVPDFLGRGESEPVAHFYQNLGEAEYVVSMYQYMRLLGYPASSISILTTYNGQRALLQDVVERRCGGHPLFGRPRVISTVDKYQGQQNDYVLLSLVRTRHFGHLRDVRRLVVAVSRARLGLFVFGRAGLFANCFELQPTFRQLLARPTQLALVPGEQYSAGGNVDRRAVEEVPPGSLLVQGVEHMASIVQQMGSEWAAQQAQQPQAAAVQNRTAGGEDEGAAADAAAPEADGEEAPAEEHAGEAAGQ